MIQKLKNKNIGSEIISINEEQEFLLLVVEKH